MKPLSMKKKTALVDAAFNRVGSGAQIPIFDLSKIMSAGLAALDSGADAPTLDAAVKAAVDAVRVN